ncbi:MATE family efflux transporter [Neobacillus terrae]|uniref:MATE family efflux transporter n=1 Tax=Neobacillus terrae TaxID=3034837 RepID=UPI00140D1C44|nr:MATE family efflux transporter [Neobacillus terrae]NHM31635.1 MATE family efflux transporter [Neobacillus terrae]
MLTNWKQILGLAIPSIASFASMTVTGMINLIMIGKLGALSIAIVGVSNIIMYNAWAAFSGIGNTVNYLVAQNYGSNDMKKGMERTYISLILSILAGIAILIIGFVAAGGILNILGGSEKIAHAGTGYLRIRFFAMFFSILTFTLHGFFRGVGNTKTPMIASLAGNAIMILFTYSLTYGHLGFPRMGLIGAGWAVFLGEVTAMLISAFAFFVIVNKKIGFIPIKSISINESKLIFKESLKLGTQEFSKSMAMFVFTAFVGRLGTNALAANEIALSIMSFGFMPAGAFGSTATILVGQEIGRNNPDKARKMGTETAIMGGLFLFVLGSFEFFFSESVARIYTDDPHVYLLTAKLIIVSAFLQIFDGFFNFYGGGLRGIGDTTFLLRSSLILAWGFFVPLTYLMVFVLSLSSYGAWTALYTYLSIFGLVLLMRFYRRDWNEIKLTVAE